MKKILAVLLIILVTGYFLYAGLQKHFYRTVLEETLVGTIRCSKSFDKNYDFYLFYFPATKETSDFIFVKLKGAVWFFEGEIIKWKKPLNIIGFKTRHRPIRIYDSAGTSYLLEAENNKLAFKIESLLPGVDTSFVSIVKQPFVPRIKFGIYATNTGYLVRRIR